MAEPIRTGILDGIQGQYAAAASGWYDTIYPFAEKLFFLLFAIELTWAAIKWTIEKEDGTPIIIALFKHLITYGFFYALLINAPLWFGALVGGFESVGQRASGMQNLNPSTVLDQGVTIVQKLFSPVKEAGLFSSITPAIVAGIASILTMLSFIVVAAQMLMAQIEAVILLSAGALLLGFGGSSFTRNFSERYISYAFSVGIKLFIIYLIVGIGNELAIAWGDRLFNDGRFSITPILEVLGASVIYAVMAWHIPSLAASMLNGQFSMHGGSAISAGLAATGAGLVATRGAAYAAATAGAAGSQALNASKLQAVNNSITRTSNPTAATPSPFMAGAKNFAASSASEFGQTIRRTALGKNSADDNALRSLSDKNNIIKGEFKYKKAELDKLGEKNV